MKPHFLHTALKESFRTRLFRWLMNLYPMYFGTGGKILFWAADQSELHVRLRLNLWTYNYVGTIFGGSLFAAADPFYMVMLLRSLGSDYVVWDKSASIRFRRPGRSTLYAVFTLTRQDLDSIRQEVAAAGKTIRDYPVQWRDKNGVVHAEIVRQCYIASKAYYQQKKGESQKTRLDWKSTL